MDAYYEFCVYFLSRKTEKKGLSLLADTKYYNISLEYQKKAVSVDIVHNGQSCPKRLHCRRAAVSWLPPEVIYWKHYRTIGEY